MSSPTAGNMVWVNTTSASTIPTPMFITNGTVTTSTTAGSWSNSVVCPTTMVAQSPQPMYIEHIPDHIKLEVGHARKISFPDGTEIDFISDGSFSIYDKDAKVIYKANRSHDFNPFINASDKLEEFIRYCGDVGVRQGDMLGIPLKHFVQWLVIEAARADGELTSEVLALPDYNQPRCRCCKRFISQKLKADRIEFCRPRCLEMKLKELTNE